jgi:hypothetical protein
MTFKLLHKGRTYTWIEKGKGAWLTVDITQNTTQMIWAGSPCNPTDLRKLNDLKAKGVTLDLLLELSRIRNVELGS